MRVLGILAVIAVVAAAVGCGGNACPDLAKQVCEKAPDSEACEAASRLTANDECEGYLKDVAKYVELMNLKVTEPGVQPPAEAPAAPAATEPAVEAPPAEDPATEVEPAIEEPTVEAPAAEAAAPATEPVAD